MADEEVPQAEGETAPAEPTFTSSVALLKVEVASGAYGDATAAQVELLGAGFAAVSLESLKPEEPEMTEEGEEIPFTLAKAAAALSAKVAADAEAGIAAKKAKAEEGSAAAEAETAAAEAAAAEAAAAAEGEEPAPAEEKEALVEAPSPVQMDDTPLPAPDITYVLVGFTDTAAVAEEFLLSDMPLDAVVTLSLPESLSEAPAPTEEEKAPEEGAPEPVAPVEGLIEYLQNYISETLPPASARNGISWASVTVTEPEPDPEPEPEAEEEPVEEEAPEPAEPVESEEAEAEAEAAEAEEPPPEPTEEELAAAAEAKAAEAKAALVAQMVEGLSTKLASVIYNRAAYAEYLAAVTVVPIPAPFLVDAESLVLYNRLLNTYEGEGGVAEGHVVYALIEQLVATFVDSNDEEGLKNEPAPDLNVLDTAVELEQTVSSALQAAMTGFGHPQLADKIGRQNWMAPAQENVDAGVKLTQDMATKLPMPGKGRSCMPFEPPKSEGDRLAQAASMYHFVDLRPEQVDRALLRDEFARMILDRESTLETRPPTPAGRQRQADVLKARWNKHLSSREYFEALAPAAMTAAYTHAVVSASPATEVYTMYCDREDTLLVTLHTPSPPDTGISAVVGAEISVPCLPTRAAFDDGYAPALIYATPPSKSLVTAEHQYMYPSDSGVMLVRKTETKQELKSYVSGHSLSSVDGALTASLKDGFVLVSEGEKLTLTDPSGRTVSIDTAGVVVTNRGSCSAAARAAELTTLDVPEVKIGTVGKKGTVVKVFADGSQDILFANGDKSAFTTEQGFWVDTNAIGSRLGRSEGQQDFFVRPLNCVSNTDYITGTEHIQREDLVHTSNFTDGTRVVEHPGSIKMTQTESGLMTVTLIDYDITVESAGDDLTVNLPSGAVLTLSNGVINAKVPSGDTLCLASAVATFVPSFPGTSSYEFNLADGSATATDPRGSVYVVSPDGECDSQIVPDSTDEDLIEDITEDDAEPEVEAILSSGTATAEDDEVQAQMLMSVATNESQDFMRGEEIEGEIAALDEDEGEEQEPEEEDDGSVDEEKEEGEVEFSDSKCPDVMPDLSEHSTMMATVLKADATIYENNRTGATALGVPLARCIKTGMDHKGPSGIVGVVAGDEESYTKFADLFDPVIKIRHEGFDPTDNHTTDLNPEKISSKVIDPEGKYIVSTRIRTARSIRGLRLAPSISAPERRKVEAILAKALLKLEGELAGDYSPLSGSESYAPKEGGMSMEEEDQMRADRHLFMESDNPVTISGGIGRDWPDARGIFVNDAKNFLVWVNEEDHTRIIAMELGGDINSVFKRYCQAVSSVQSNLQSDGYDFQHSEHLGYLLTCPSQIGTGMRASVMIKIPLFSEWAREGENFKAVCKNMKLDVRGEGIDGVYDISNHDRLGRSEVQLVNCLKDGIAKIISIEETLEAGGEITEMVDEIAAICAANEVYGDEAGPPPPPKDVSSHAPRCFVVRPDGSGFEWAIQEEILYALQNGNATGEVIATEPNSMVHTLEDRTVTMHPGLDEDELEKLQDGLARFEAWEIGEGDAGELLPPKAEPEPEPEPVPEPEPEPEPVPEPEPEPEPEVVVDSGEPPPARLPSEVKALDDGAPPGPYWGSRESEFMVESEGEWRARAASKAPSPDSGATKEQAVAGPAPAPMQEQGEEEYDEGYDEQYGYGSAGAPGTGLKTNMLLTADTLPPDVYGQPRRFVPSVPALRPDHVVSTVPNVQYAVVEGPARRRLHGMASNSLDLMPAPGSSAPQQFLVHPGMLDFGAVAEGGTYRMTISMTNISVEMARFRVRVVPNPLIKLKYTPGRVMAGMSTKIEVELTAGIPCVIDDMVQITSEAQIFSLPLLAQVGDGGGDDQVPSPSMNESKKASTLRSEVTQASAAMATKDDLVEGTGIGRPVVPDEVEWVAKDVDAMSLDELKAQAAKAK